MSERQKGQGHLFKRGKNWYLRFTLNGKRKTVSLKTTLKIEAEKLSKTYLPVINAETREELATHVAIAKKLKNANKSLSVSEAWEHFLKHPARPELNKSTLSGYDNFHHFLFLLEVCMVNCPLLASDIRMSCRT